MEKQFNVLETNAKSRLDVFVAENAEVSRSLASTLISTGKVLVNGAETKANYKVINGICLDF